MTIVQVIGVNVEAERLQEAHAADAEDDLLLEPIEIVAPIKVMGQYAISSLF
jgi:hypothetical protein